MWITAELRDAGRRVNHKRIERVMRAAGIVGLHLRKKVRTTLPEPSATTVPDLIQRDFTATAPNTRYVGDITYLPVQGGRFLCLATVLDLHSKRLAGWSVADHMRTEAGEARRTRKAPTASIRYEDASVREVPVRQLRLADFRDSKPWREVRSVHGMPHYSGK